MLYIVPTPIGNIEDVTWRAIGLLKEVDLILAEDTRTSGKLLKHYDIHTSMNSFHAFNEHKVLQGYIDLLLEEKNIALISDAGTPGISDPGFLLIRAAVENDIPISCLPGATAMIPALVMSGLPCDKFYYEGFLPHKKGRQTRWKFLSTLPCTFVLYESPHRIHKCIKEIIAHCGPDRRLAIVREISKIYEEAIRGTAQEISKMLEEKKLKGEIVVVVEGNLI